LKTGHGHDYRRLSPMNGEETVWFDNGKKTISSIKEIIHNSHVLNLTALGIPQLQPV
jgi:hypothetical protein